jgi:Ribonuclease G/E
MANHTNKVLREGYDRLKKTWEKILKPDKKQVQPQLVLQPIRNRETGKKYLRGTDLH